MIELHDTGTDAVGLRDDDRASEPRHVVAAVARGYVLLVGVLVAVGLVVTSLDLVRPVRTWDLLANEGLSIGRSDGLVSVARTVSRLGDTFGVIGLALVISAALTPTRRWRVVLLIPIALLIEVTTFLAVNYLVRRPRPDVVTVGSVPSTFSFPSGHVAATLVCWVGLAIALRCLGARRAAVVFVAAVAVVATVAMGWARVYLGMHHPTDIAAGVAMGIAATMIAADALGSRGETPSGLDQPKIAGS